MTQDDKSFSQKLSTWLFGNTAPPTPAPPAVDEAALHQKLDAILKAVQALPQDQTQPENLEKLNEQVRKLAKTQFKTNTVQEKQTQTQTESLEALQSALDRLQNQQAQAITQAQLELIKSLLPSLDGLDAAFNIGRKQVLNQALDPQAKRAMIAWLDGVRLARLRLHDVLEAHNVKRIPTVGRPFDPNFHVAIATDTSGRAANGIIVQEDRAGYATPNTVLRFAEVVVSQYTPKS